MNGQGQEDRCKYPGCERRRLWGADYCAEHLEKELGPKEIWAWRRAVEENKSNLQQANLQGADLSGAKLQGAELYRANLQWADLRFADLQGADLSTANLQGAKLSGADLQSAKLIKANLQGANLSDAKLQGADLLEADLQGANLFIADLQGTDLSSAKLQGADISSAKLQGAVLYTAKLQGAKLSFARLQEADLRLADLQGANLLAADLQGATLSYGDLQGADFSFANLANANLVGISFSEASRVPLWAQALALCLWLWIKTRDLSVLAGPFRHLRDAWQGAASFFSYFESLQKKARELLPGEEDRRGCAEVIARMAFAPTRWNSAAVDNLGPCNPLDIRYIKDQAYLEARIEKSRESWWDRVWMFVWGITSGYGTNIWLLIIWSAGLAILFGIIFWITGCLDYSNLGREPAWFTHFYFSVVTFTNLGFGDVTPSCVWCKVLMFVEKFFGYFMLGGLISILATKLARLAG